MYRLRPRLLSRFPTPLMLLGLLFLLTGFRFFAPSWEAIHKRIENTFPEVPHISVEQLNELMLKEDILLIDVREPQEFAVSTIRGAKNWTTPEEVAQLTDKQIVVFCSVGYRSAAFVRKLQNQGYRNVVNLKGSIFEWANKGMAVYQGDRKTYFVHPYNDTWGELLNASLHSDTPAF